MKLPSRLASVLSIIALSAIVCPVLGQATRPATESAAALPPTTSPAILPGNGLSQHPFFYAGEWDHRKPEQTMFIVRGGKIVWTYSIPTKTDGKLAEFSDATMLSNGNVVYAAMSGAAKISPDKKVLWKYEAPAGTEVHVIQPIDADRVMMVQNGRPARLMVINTVTNVTEKEFELPTGPATTSVHGQLRRARMTREGTFLVAHMGFNKVAEYNGEGKEIWSIDVPSPWAAVRLKTGNTLLTSNRGFVREVDPSGRTVWEFTQNDIPDIRLFSLQEANRLANGNTLITNWCPNGLKDPKDWPSSVQAIEVTPDKKVVWALRSWEAPADLGPATSLQLLDEPGIPEALEQQR